MCNVARGFSHLFVRVLPTCIRQTGRNSFADLQQAKAVGAHFDHSCPGFKQRNTSVARSCDRMLALTWTDGTKPDGGELVEVRELTQLSSFSPRFSRLVGWLVAIIDRRHR